MTMPPRYDRIGAGDAGRIRTCAAASKRRYLIEPDRGHDGVRRPQGRVPNCWESPIEELLGIDGHDRLAIHLALNALPLQRAAR